MELPQFNEERKIAEKGVAIVKDIVENNLNWLFRKVPLEEDFGIDGYIDILHDGKYVTGKSIGVQIKTGNSYFQTKSNSGWIFYGNNKHLNYYLNNNNPIIIVIVEPETKKCFWTEVDINNITKTEKSWKITINEKSELVNKKALSSITSDFIDYTPQLEYMTLVNKEIRESGLLFVAIDRVEIEEQNFDGIHALLKMLISSDEMINKCRNKLMLTVFGYDTDSRELFEISKVRHWMKEALNIFKFWGYFVYMDKNLRHASTLKTLLACNIRIKVKKRDKNKKVIALEYDTDEVAEFKSKIFEWLNEFSETYNIDKKSNFEQSMLVLQTIDNISDTEVEKIRIKYGFE